MSHNVQLITTEGKHIIRFLLIDFENSFNLTNQTATHLKSEKKIVRFKRIAKEPTVNKSQF